MGVRERRKKQKLCCNGKDRGHSTSPERGQTSVRSFFARKFEKFLNGAKQMNKKLCAASNTTNGWEKINFQTAERYVKKLQMRIAKAVKEQRWSKVRSLQWILTHSFYAKALAIKRVTENKGKRTSGIDHETWQTPLLL